MVHAMYNDQLHAGRLTRHEQTQTSPVPGFPTVALTRALLTTTVCHPQLSPQHSC